MLKKQNKRGKETEENCANESIKKQELFNIHTYIIVFVGYIHFLKAIHNIIKFMLTGLKYTKTYTTYTLHCFFFVAYES